MNYQPNRAFNNPGGNRGFTLIELLITLVVGMIVLAGVIAFATKVLQVNSAVLRSARLNQDLGTTLQVMVNDIRRAGYEGYDLEAGLPENAAGIYGDQDEDDIVISMLSVANDCILYSYDQNGDGILDKPSEQFGFRLGNGAIQSRKNGADCSAAIDDWDNITDSEAITISSLSFDTEGSKCKNMNNSDYWITDDNGATGFPCTATDDTYVQSYSRDSDNEYEVSSFVAPFAADSTDSTQTPDKTVETRQVNIRLEGKVKRPARFEDTASIKNLEVSTKIRNDRVCLHYLKSATYPDNPPVCAH